MSDLIKRENAIATIGVMYERCGGDITDYRDLLLQCFKDLPSGIVRCKECKYADDCEQQVLMATMCYEVEKAENITYCSYGERSE